MFSQKTQNHSNHIVKEGHVPQNMQNACFLFAQIHFMMPESAANFVAVN
jgi:hypothetical protein